MQRFTTTGLARLVLLGLPWLAAGQTQAAHDTVPHETTGERLTADQQKMNPADEELTRRIRRSVMDDETLSMYAHNVKIISRDGVVTLKGAVRTEKEKETVAAKARAIAGSDRVSDELTVTSQATTN